MLLTLNRDKIDEQLQRLVPLVLTLSLLVMPLSSTVRGIFVGTLVLLILLLPSYRQDLLALLKKPWCQGLFLFFFIVLLTCFWGPASTYQKIAIVKKYTKIIYLPIFVVGFRVAENRRFALYAFLTAMVLTCLVSFAKASDMIDYNGPDPGQVFNNHIITGLMMSFAAYLALFFAIKERGKMRWMFASLFFMFSFQILFVSTGRTGYVCYLLLMILLMIQTLSWKKATAASLLSMLLFVVSYYHSAPMQFVVKQGIDNFHDYQQGHINNPIGFRLQFRIFAKKLFLQHPWIGNGAGSYTYYFKKEDPVPAWREMSNDVSFKKMYEPHSQYWLVLDECGLLGLGALLFFFGGLLRESFRLHEMKPIALAIILPFSMGCATDSLLFYSASGYFFLLLMAVCLGEQQNH